MLPAPFPIAAARRLAAVGLALLAVVAAPTHAAADDADREPIVVGMVNAQSGPPARIGIGYRTAAEAVFRDVNAHGGIHGRLLVLHSADDGYEPDRTLAHTLDLVEDQHAVAMLGYVGTANASAVLPLLVHRNVPMLGVFSGGSALRTDAGSGFFHTRASYADEAEALVERLVAGGARRVAVLYQNDGFGHDVLRGTEQALARRGLALAGGASYQRGTVAVRTAVQRLRASAPDAVVLAATEATAMAFMEQTRAAGVQARFASVSAFVTSDDGLRGMGASGDRLLVSQVVPFPGDEQIAAVRECRRILAAGQAEAAEPLAHVTLEGCLNARTLVQALMQAGPEPTRASLMASLEAMRTFDLGGVTVGFSPANHQSAARVYMTEVVDGRMERAR